MYFKVLFYSRPDLQISYRVWNGFHIIKLLFSYLVNLPYLTFCHNIIFTQQKNTSMYTLNEIKILPVYDAIIMPRMFFLVKIIKRVDRTYEVIAFNHQKERSQNCGCLTQASIGFFFQVFPYLSKGRRNANTACSISTKETKFIVHC